MKVEILPPLSPKNVKKIGTLSLRSMENCSQPNSGTVGHIQFKLGTGIEHPRDMTPRSKVKVTTSRKVSG